MQKAIYAAFISAMLLSASPAAFAQDSQPSYSDYPYGSATDLPSSPTNDPAAVPFDGPRPSSLGNWSGMTDEAARAAVPAAPTSDISRASPENWPGMMDSANPAYGSSADPSFAGSRPGPNR